MATKLVKLKDTDKFPTSQITALNLPRKTALATYLKDAYGERLDHMTDENWLQEAADVLEMLGV